MEPATCYFLAQGVLGSLLPSQEDRRVGGVRLARVDQSSNVQQYCSHLPGWRISFWEEVRMHGSFQGRLPHCCAGKPEPLFVTPLVEGANLAPAPTATIGCTCSLPNEAPPLPPLPRPLTPSPPVLFAPLRSWLVLAPGSVWWRKDHGWRWQPAGVCKSRQNRFSRLVYSEYRY